MHPRGTIVAVAALLCLGGCLEPWDESVWDPDGDGYGPEVDCANEAGDDDDNAAIHPGAEEICDGIDNDCDEEIDEADHCQDPDGDKYSEHAGDCHPHDPSIYPHAHEICDGKDNDCDGAIDEVHACQDLDGDGVLGADDCDDDDPFSFPLADEVCDGRDNDCDGQLVGDEDEDDSDGDGWLSCETCSPSAVDCTWHEGILGGGDCDDGDAEKNPGEGEICNYEDSEDCTSDNDVCAGLAGEISLSAADVVWIGSAMGGRPGNSVAGGVNADGVEFDDILIGGNGGQGAARNGVVWFDLAPEGGIQFEEDVDAVWEGLEDTGAGSAVALSRDLTGDGLPDAVVGGQGYSALGSGELGVVHVLFGPLPADGNLATLPGLTVVGEADDQWVGKDVSTGDLDGDGQDDLVFSARGYSAQRGAVFALFGPLSASPTPLQLVDMDASWRGTEVNQRCGTSVDASGDVDQDDIDDLLVGATYAEDTRGAMYLFLGPAFHGQVDADQADVVWIGEFEGDYVGDAAAHVGDVDGDGFGDLLFGARFAFGATGGAYLVLGPPAEGEHVLPAGVDVTFVGEDVDDWAGTSLAAAGDVDGDGLDDLLIGALNAEHLAGQVCLMRGSTALPAEVQLFDGCDVEIEGASPGDLAGEVLASAGDHNGDGCDDILIGSAVAESGLGAVYLLFGGGPSCAARARTLGFEVDGPGWTRFRGRR